jgi:hypothetical protein
MKYIISYYIKKLNKKSVSDYTNNVIFLKVKKNKMKFTF